MCQLLGPLPSSTAFLLPPAACGPVLHPVEPAPAPPGPGLPHLGVVVLTHLRVMIEVTEIKTK